MCDEFLKSSNGELQWSCRELAGWAKQDLSTADLPASASRGLPDLLQ